jgi:hypothetical protein
MATIVTQQINALRHQNSEAAVPPPLTFEQQLELEREKQKTLRLQLQLELIQAEKRVTEKK